MQTGGSFAVAIPQDRVFAFVSDPFKLAACIPGCENLHETSTGTYAAVLNTKLGPITLRFDVTVQLTRVEPPTAIDATIAGTAAGSGRLSARAEVRLAAPDAATTDIAYTIEMTLAGKLGSFGQPVFRAKSDELSKKFAVNLKAALEDAEGVG